MLKIKPCPHCGGEGMARWDSTSGMKGSGAFGYASVTCRKCGATPYALTCYVNDDEEHAVEGVINLWNRRAEDREDKQEPKRDDVTLSQDQVSTMCDVFCRFPHQVKNDEKLIDICVKCPMTGMSKDLTDGSDLPQWGDIVD